MKALTLKEIFKAIEMTNQLSDITLDANHNIRIYINNDRVFDGTSYAKFKKTLNEEYIDTFVVLVLDVLFVTNKANFYDWNGREHEIEFYVYSK